MDVWGTVDVSLPQFRYLADHLQPAECRRLLAALHYTSYNKPNALDDAGRYVDNMCSGIRLL